MVLLVRLRPTPLLLSFKREDDGREGAVSGRLARKATGVSPSGFARIGVFAGNWYLPIFLDTTAFLHCCGKLRNRVNRGEKELGGRGAIAPSKGAFLRPYSGPRSTTIVVGVETL